MTKERHLSLARVITGGACLVACTVATAEPAYHPMNWVNDPFCANTNFSLAGASTSSPHFINNGIQRGTLYANSPIGATLSLVNPGDTISCTGQVVLSGDVNVDGNVQFRVGLYYRGTNTTDTNWLGYTFGNVTGDSSSAVGGLYVRNNPNPGIYASGTPANATRPRIESASYTPGWRAGKYDFALSVSLLPAKNHKVSWKICSKSYNYSGIYTNTVATTMPPAFDQIGIMGGAAIFQSASTSNSISFNNVTVSLAKTADPR